MSEERVTRQVIDGHSHIGEMAPWQFYDLKEPVKPTVYEFATSADYLGHMDGLGVERALVLPNYGIPVQEQPFSLNPLVLDALSSSDRLRGGLWVSFLPQNKEMTLEALTHAGEAGVVALKTTFLLGGNPYTMMPMFFAIIFRRRLISSWSSGGPPRLAGSIRAYETTAIRWSRLRSEKVNDHSSRIACMYMSRDVMPMIRVCEFFASVGCRNRMA